MHPYLSQLTQTPTVTLLFTIINHLHAHLLHNAMLFSKGFVALAGIQVRNQVGTFPERRSKLFVR
jgi:hypothetical protein